MIKKCLLLLLVFSLHIMFLYAGTSESAITILDDFNRPNGPLNSDWTTHGGTFNVINNAVQGGEYAIATFNGMSSNILEADIEATGSGVQYVALVLGYRDLDTNYFIKAQDDDGGTPDFTGLYCYYGNNRHLPSWPNDSFPLSPSFTSAHMRVEYNPNAHDIIITFSHIDGGPGTQQYICSDAPLTGGNGIGIGSYDISRGKIDNFSADVTLFSIPTLTEWGMIVFMVFAGSGAIYRLWKRKKA